MKKAYKDYGRFFELDEKNDVIAIDPEILKHRKNIKGNLMWEMISFFGKTKKYKTCSLCGYNGPAIDSHHIHGRKNSPETIEVCCNCHRELHVGTRTL